MKKLRPLIAALMALGFYTITDILVWQRIFEVNQLVLSRIPIMQAGSSPSQATPWSAWW